jgi:hypothetical protein
MSLCEYSVPSVVMAHVIPDSGIDSATFAIRFPFAAYQAAS